MPMTTATIRMDSELKAQLQTLMSELGLDMSTFFIMSAKQAVREQGIPFKITIWYVFLLDSIFVQLFRYSYIPSL